MSDVDAEQIREAVREHYRKVARPMRPVARPAAVAGVPARA
jgi:hypothetical protein